MVFLCSACNKNLQETKVEKTMDQTMKKTSQTKLAPLIDRDIFFGNPEISYGQLSPDGSHVSFMKEHEGIMNIWVKKFDDAFSQAKLLTASSSPILGYFWSRDSKYILYVNDIGGDENMNVFAVNPSAPAVGAAPQSKNLTPLKEVTAQIYSVSRKDPDLMMIGLNDRDKAWHDLYKLKISTGELTKVLENNNRYTGYDFDWDENLRLAYRTDKEGNSQILKVETDGSFKEIYATNIKESAYVYSWTPDNKECYLVTNKGDINFSTLYKLNPETGALTLFETDPKGKADFGSLWVNDDTREIIATSYTYDKRVRYFKDPKWEGIYKYVKNKFPNKEIGFNSFTKDYSKMLISVFGDDCASEVYYHDPVTKDLILQYTPRPKLKAIEASLAEMKPISYPSSDGLMIPGYLSIPKGSSGKNMPAVILVHGGPKGPRDDWGYSSYVQFLTNRGYVVMQPNFRASGGYGKEFLNAGDKQWGKLMQDDITWGVKHLVKKGIIDPDRVAIMGGSYGGYATLAGLAFTPDVYACGIDIVGPSNLFTLLESIPAYWEAGRKWLYEMVGDPDTEEGQKLLREASPLFSVDNISKPLLIVQGANDPRVKQAESDQIVIALRDKGHPVDYILAEDEGHGFRKPLNRMAMMAQSEKFLAEYIGGRYQTEIPADVAETLKKLTVDVSTVVHKQKEDIEALKALPAINYNWKASESEYDITLEMQGQKMPMTMKRTVVKEGDKWVISDIMQSPMGPVKDIVYFDTGFNASKRMMEQGGQKMNFAYEPNKINANIMGKDMAIETKGLAISDGAGVDMLIGALGMKKGDKLAYYVADMMTMKPKQIIAEHHGTESMDGKSYNKITLTNAENDNEVTALYFNPATQIAERMESVIPAMGNAKMTITKK